MIIDGKQFANEILKNLKQKLSTKGSDPKVAPTMAVILVGENSASLSYIKQKQKSAEAIGVKVVLKQFPTTISQIGLINQISQINSNPNIHGIIIQRPVPIFKSHPELARLAVAGRQRQVSGSNPLNESVSPEKDIDGFHPKSKFIPPVGLAVLHVLSHCHPEFISGSKSEISNPQFINWLNSQKIILLGRGETGGKPIVNTLDKFKIKYTQTHSKTPNTKGLLKQADIIISAVGKPNLITGNMIKKGSICIGVGISRSPVIANSVKDSTKLSRSEIPQMAGQSQSKLIGDFDEESVSQKASFYTPTPGGIGPLTVAYLLDNLINAWGNKKS